MIRARSAALRSARRRWDGEGEGGAIKSFPSRRPPSICMLNDAEQELIVGVMASDWPGSGVDHGLGHRSRGGEGLTHTIRLCARSLSPSASLCCLLWDNRACRCGLVLLNMLSLPVTFLSSPFLFKIEENTAFVCFYSGTYLTDHERRRDLKEIKWQFLSTLMCSFVLRGTPLWVSGTLCPFSQPVDILDCQQHVLCVDTAI